MSTIIRSLEKKERFSTFFESASKQAHSVDFQACNLECSKAGSTFGLEKGFAILREELLFQSLRSLVLPTTVKFPDLSHSLGEHRPSFQHHGVMGQS